MNFIYNLIKNIDSNPLPHINISLLWNSVNIFSSCNQFVLKTSDNLYYSVPETLLLGQLPSSRGFSYWFSVQAMLYWDDDSQWVGKTKNFSSKEDCLNFTSDCYRCYTHDEDFYKTFQIVIDSLVIFVSSLGLVGNFMSIYILSKTEFSSRFSNLLIMLAYADIRWEEDWFDIHTLTLERQWT